MKSFYEIREKTLTPEKDKAKEVRKQNPGFKDGKIIEATKQKLFMFKTEAEAKAHAKKNGGKVVKYSPTNYAVLDKDLTKKPGQKPDGMVKEANMTAAQKAKFDALYKQHLNGKQHKILKQTIQNPIKADSAYHSMIKTLAMKEDTQIDEISMGKMAAYADKAVKSRNDAKARTYSADTHRVAKAGETIRKRKAGADNYNKKMWGYANVAPTKESVGEAMGHISAIQAMIAKEREEKKKREAKKESAGLDEKGPAIKQDNIKVIRTADKAHSDAMGRTPAGRKKPTKAPVVEAKVGPSHDEIMKAIGNTQSSAQGMAILQKKFKLTAAQARKHMDMFLKDDVNEGAPYDSGWKDAKPEVKKDKFGNVIKDKNVAKNLAKSAMKSFKDIRKK